MACQIVYIQGVDLETSNLVAHIEPQLFEKKKEYMLRRASFPIIKRAMLLHKV